VETPKVELSFSDILWAVGFLFGTGDSGLACSANEEKNIIKEQLESRASLSQSCGVGRESGMWEKVLLRRESCGQW
jgi:hypothetical protein